MKLKMRDIFPLNLKTFTIDLITFIIGIFLFVGYTRFCRIELETPCFHPALYYIGFILITISIIHFIINLVIFIVNKINKNKK